MIPIRKSQGLNLGHLVGLGMALALIGIVVGLVMLTWDFWFGLYTSYMR